MEDSSVSPRAPLSASFPSVVPYHTGWNISPEEGAMSLEKALADGKLLEVISMVRETMKTASSTPVNIAVTGNSGNGMSTFINALRGIGHEEEDSAPTGLVRTTQTRGSYLFSCFPNVVLWDLPGMGTLSQSLEDYVLEMEFSQYDLFIIIASEQFSMNHVMLAKTMKRMGKKFYIVWTKLDRDLSTSHFREGHLLKNIQESILENLQKEQVDEPPIFLVSSLDPLLYDFQKLRDTLQMDISHIKYNGPLQMLSYTCEKVINDKVISLKKKMATHSLQDTVGIWDPDDSMESLNTYRMLFGVGDESVEQMAQRMKTATVHYMALIKSQNLQTLRRSDCKLRFLTCRVFKAFLNFLRYTPLLGNPVIRYFRLMKHKCILELVAKDTKTILGKVLKDSIPD
ncbi:immunity-related GTPase family M protein 1-like [Orycteropus afer afer]|uniref:Immunity-related GTPase family M protein 1-like n=1 Tax=Orycteropus afer afer TaxID=1230840 RepID=A0A8B7AWX5_ORYAF|nr:immunity-related GTPase family M protein 1-like [Orycteropus afer afer]